jgi:predicted nucleic acid-binding protein
VDADCLIAGVLTSEGATSRLIDRWRAGDFELVVSSRLVHEVHKALVSPRIARRYDISESDALAFAKSLTDYGLTVEDPESPPRVVPDDPNDDYLVELAKAYGILVTRDRHFEKVEVEGLRIVGPREALTLLDS